MCHPSNLPPSVHTPRDREMKVAARNEALEKAAEELQKKIELKVIYVLRLKILCNMLCAF